MVTKISDFLNTTFSTLSVDDAINAAVSYPGTLIHTSTSAPAAGIGVGLRFQTETAANNNEIGMTVEAVTTDVTAASEDFDLVVRLMQNGAAAAERLRVTSAGAASAGSFRPTSSTAPANGMYLPAANTVAITTNGTDALRLTATNNLLVNSSTTPLGGASTITLNGPGTNAGGIELVGGSSSGGGNIAGISSGGIAIGTFTGAVGAETYTERMRIESSGRVGIGTTSTVANFEIWSSAVDNAPHIALRNRGGVSNGSFGPGIIFDNGLPGVNPFIASMHQGQTTSGGNIFAISRSGTPFTKYFTIDQVGNIGIGDATVTVGYKLDVGGSVRVSGGIVATGEISAYFSDQRLKSNITAITNAVDKVMAINGVYYNANDLAVEIAGEDKTIQRVGLLAQEVEAVLPHVVKAAPFDIGDHGISKSGENYKTLQYERIVPLLVEAIKEQQQQIDKLTKRVEQLENKSSI